MKAVTINDLQQRKNNREKFAVVTAYDASFARVISEAGVEAILIGDSLGMVVQGHNSTVKVTMDELCYHVACVARGNRGAFLIADMPFMSYSTPEQTYQNATRLMQAGAQMVKLEGGHWLHDSIRGLTERGIAVCAHLGLTPQSVDSLGGFKVQGRDEKQAEQILSDARALQEAGARMLVLECIPSSLAKRVTNELTIPVIGIGAGADTDAQVLVLHDMLGLFPGKPPKFVKNFMERAGSISEAFEQYVKAVKEGDFPTSDHEYES